MTIRRVPVMAAPQSEPSAQLRPDDAASSVAIPEKLIKPWKLPPQKAYVLKNANIIDPVTGSIKPRRTIKLSDGRIESIGASTEASSGDVVVDLDGRYVCPGLIDCHVHLTAVAGSPNLADTGGSNDPAELFFRQPFLCRQILSRGFTTVRDTGGANLALKEAIADDVFPGPRLFISNRALSQTGGHGDRRGAHDLQQQCCGGHDLSTVIDGVPECTRVARGMIRTGADFIKIMSGGGVASPTDRLENTQFSAAEIQAISEVAESYGTWVTAHAYTPKAIRHAVDNGVKGIEHGNLIDEDTAKYMAERGIWLTPTLVAYDTMGSDKYRDFLPPANAGKNREVLARGLDSLRMADEAGVVMCHGTDLLGPLWEEQSKEFGLRAQVLSSKKVLQGATINAARMLRQDEFLGQVKEGFAADLLIMNENPLDDITCLDHPETCVLAVIKNGRVYTSRWGKLPDDVTEPQQLIE